VNRLGKEALRELSDLLGGMELELNAKRKKSYRLK